MKPAFKHIAETCRYARTNNTELSQGDVSHLLGYRNGQFMSNVERAKCNLPPNKILLASEILKIPVSHIIDAMLRDFRDALLDETQKPVLPSMGGDILLKFTHNPSSMQGES